MPNHPQNTELSDSSSILNDSVRGRLTQYCEAMIFVADGSPDRLSRTAVIAVRSYSVLELNSRKTLQSRSIL